MSHLLFCQKYQRLHHLNKYWNLAKLIFLKTKDSQINSLHKCKLLLSSCISNVPIWCDFQSALEFLLSHLIIFILDSSWFLKISFVRANYSVPPESAIKRSIKSVWLFKFLTDSKFSNSWYVQAALRTVILHWFLWKPWSTRPPRPRLLSHLRPLWFLPYSSRFRCLFSRSPGLSSGRLCRSVCQQFGFFSPWLFHFISRAKATLRFNQPNESACFLVHLGRD